MASIALTTRISRAALRILRDRAQSAHLGPSAFASRLLEHVLLGREALPHRTELTPSRIHRALAEEHFFASLALTKFLEKQPGFVPKLRAEARTLARELFADRDEDA